MSPYYRAVRDSNTTTIPAEYLPDDQETAVFRILNRNNPGRGPKPPDEQ